MPGTPTAFLWPRLPASTPYLGPSLGLGIALRVQREEMDGRVPEADAVTAERAQAWEYSSELGSGRLPLGSPTTGGTEIRAPAGQPRSTVGGREG